MCVVYRTTVVCKLLTMCVPHLQLQCQMTCKPKDYPSLMDPPHDAISGPMQLDSMTTLIVPYNFSVPALCEGHPRLYQPSLEITIIASLEILSGKPIKMATSTPTVCVYLILYFTVLLLFCFLHFLVPNVTAPIYTPPFVNAIVH